MSDHSIRFSERTLASVRAECVCGWKAECSGPSRQLELNARVANHFLRSKLEALVPMCYEERREFEQTAIEVVADMLLLDNDDDHKRALEELGAKVYAHGRRYLIDKALR